VIVVEAAAADGASLGRSLVETHLKQPLRVKAAENRLQKVQTDLKSSQGEIASGQMVEFLIKPELVGLTIGKKGARIKQIEIETGVSSINVGDKGHIMIYGPDSTSVSKAKELLELKEDRVVLSHDQAEYLTNKTNTALLGDLKTTSNLMVVKLNIEGKSVDFVGTAPAIHMAKVLLSTQLEYVDKQIEIEHNEREAREKLQAVRKQVYDLLKYYCILYSLTRIYVYHSFYSLV
jgi:polyribonucleotide nucleotidyltransferase